MFAGIRVVCLRTVTKETSTHLCQKCHLLSGSRRWQRPFPTPQVIQCTFFKVRGKVPSVEPDGVPDDVFLRHDEQDRHVLTAVSRDGGGTCKKKVLGLPVSNKLGISWRNAARVPRECFCNLCEKLGAEGWPNQHRLQTGPVSHSPHWFTQKHPCQSLRVSQHVTWPSESKQSGP